jgi:hypothetical protein
MAEGGKESGEDMELDERACWMERRTDSTEVASAILLEVIG